MLRIIVASLLLTGAVQAQEVVAQRGSIRLTTADVQALLAKTSTAVRAQLTSNPAAMTEFVRDRLLRQSMLAEAKAKNWDQTPDIADRLADARDQLIVNTYIASLAPVDPAYPSEDEIAAAYDASKSTLMRPRQYKLAEIVLLAAAGTPQDDAARKRLAALHRQAVQPHADFAELARRNSQDRSNAEKGGEVGWVRDDQLAPSIKDAIAALPDGGVTDPIRVGDSLHVVKLLASRPAGPAPLEEVRDQIVQALRQQRAQQLTRAALDDSLRKEPIQINEIALQLLSAHSP